MAHRIETSAGPVDYDRLVLAPGAELVPSALEGFQSDARNLYTLEGVLELREDLRTFRRGKVVVLISSIPFKCPAAPYEAAFLLDYHFRRLGLRRSVSREIVLASDARIPYDLLVGVPPHRAPGFVRDAGLVDGSGWVPVDARTLKTSADHVFAIGDVAAIKLASGMFLP